MTQIAVMTAMRPEAKIEDYFEKAAKRNNFLQYKFTSGVTGVPDRIIVGNGLTAFVELKAAKGKLSQRQKLVINDIKRRGGLVFVPYSKEDVDEIIRYINKNGAN